MSNKILHNGFCPVCGQPILEIVKMKDGTVCKECATKVRVLFPVHYEKRKETGKGKASFVVDPLEEVPVSDYDAAFKKARAYRDSLREKYNGYNAVYMVDNVETVPGSGRFEPPVINVYGRVLYGTFFIDDTVMLRHGDNTAMIRLRRGKVIKSASPVPITAEDIKDEERSYLFTWHAEGTAPEGYPFQFIFNEKDLTIEAGDLIVK